MSKFLLIIIIALLFSCKQPFKPNLPEAKSFFEQIDDSALVKGHLLLVDSVQTKSFFEWYQLNNDTIFSKNEMSTIKDQISATPAAIWPDAIFSDFQIVTQKYIDSAGQKNPLTGTPLHYAFSYPYFIRNNTYCLISYYIYCGILCAEESLRIYKKVNDRWILVKDYVAWVS